MREIIILGAGRSASSLIQYLVEHAPAENWRVTVADRDEKQAQHLIGQGSEVARVLVLDANNAEERAKAIAEHDLVISMLPAFMHMDVLKDCLRLKKHVITPSYVPDALWALDAEFKASDLVQLNEIGLDPGIDHMSAMRILDRIRAAGGTVDSFESYCGGLVAPESDDNPWGYKFSWNPRNVILAGQGTAAKYIRKGETKYLPYHKLFQQTVAVEVHGLGAFEGYPNRDSLKYRKAYGIDSIPTLVRGTLRKAGYSAAWDTFVQLGCTEDGFAMELPATATWREYISAFLPGSSKDDTREVLAKYLNIPVNGDVIAKLDWLGLFGNEAIGVSGLSPAATLQHLLEQKWKLGVNDKDLVVMWHRFRYAMDGAHKELLASLAVIGKDQTHTAMAQTVGLPIAIASKMVLNGLVQDRGVLLPLKASLYDPILDELEQLGITFTEEVGH